MVDEREEFDFVHEMNVRIRTIVQSGDLDKMITENLRKSVETTVKSAVESVFGYGGNGTKAIKEAIETGMQISAKDFTIPSYRKTILNMVQDELNSRVSSFGVEMMKQAVDQILKDEVPVEVTFDDVISKLKEQASCFKDEHETGHVSVHLDPDNRNLNFIHFDEDEGVEKYQCGHRLVLNEVDDRPGFFKIYSYEFQGKTYNSKKSFGQETNGFGSYLFRMYSAGTVIRYDYGDVYDRLEELTEWGDNGDW